MRDSYDKIAFARRLATTAGAILLIAGCGDDTTRPPPTDAGVDMAMPDTGSDTGDVENAAPMAAADATGPVAVGESIRLDASGSSDPDGDELSFAWSVVSKPDSSNATLSGAESANASLVADVAGTYTVSVEVTDGLATDSTEVSTDALGMPVADAGPDQTGEVGSTIEFDGGASSTPGDAELSYDWQFVTKPDTSTATFDDSTAVVASMTPDVEGTYIVELTVSNGAQSATDRVTAEIAPEGGRLTSTVYVAPSGDDSNRGTQAAPLATIDEAFAVFENQEMVNRISLAAGNYELSDTKEISSDLDISGPSADGEEAVIWGPGDLFDLTGEAFLTLLDVTVESDREAVYVSDDAAVSMIGVTCRAERCVRTGGLFSEPGGRVEVRRSTLVGTGSSSSGLALTTPDEASIVDTTIRGFETSGITNVDGPLTLRDSVIRENGYGVHLVVNDSTNATQITNTEFTMNDQGLRNDGAENVTVEQSTFDSQEDEGLYLNNGAVILRDSNVESGNSHGVLVRGETIFTLRATEVFGNDGAGVRVEGAGSIANLGTQTSSGDNSIFNNKDGQLYDARPDGATGEVKMSATELSDGIASVEEPPAGTYTGPGFDQYGIVITGSNSVVVY